MILGEGELGTSPWVSCEKVACAQEWAWTLRDLLVAGAASVGAISFGIVLRVVSLKGEGVHEFCVLGILL